MILLVFWASILASINGFIPLITYWKPRYSLKVRSADQKSPEELLQQTLSLITSLEDPKQEPAIYNAGILYLSLNDEEKALEMFRTSVKLNDCRDSSWFNLALLEEAADADPKVIIEAYSKVIETTRKESVASASFNNVFEFLFRSRKYDEAAKWADSHVQNLPEDCRGWFNAGVIMRENGNLDWAVACFEKAAREFPGDNRDRSSALASLGDAHSRLRQWSEAIAAYKEAVSINEDDADAYYHMALIYRDGLHDDSEALRAFEQCLVLAPDHSQAPFQLAALRHGCGVGDVTAAPSPTRAPEGYVQELFDHYASAGYEAHMLGQLQYRGHELVVTSLLNAAAASGKASMERLLTSESSLVVDLGCGTGLVGKAWRGCGALCTLVGCDLSPNMVNTARSLLYERRKSTAALNQVTCHVYEQVVVADCGQFLGTLQKESCTAILAGDVFCYLGDLEVVLSAAGAALAPGGWVVFSVESLDAETVGENPVDPYAHVGPNDGHGFVLQSSGRFAHSRAAVLRAATKGGLRPAPSVHAEQETVLRLQGWKPVRGTVYVFEKAVDSATIRD